MKTFLILLFLSYVCSDKLDLTYLPPPGTQYSGGRPEDIQTPLELPKHTYSTTFRPQSIQKGQGLIRTDDYRPTIGINRESVSKDSLDFPGSKASVYNYQSSINPPSTTTSYAFSQTTTYPPPESYETTLSSITGFPSSNNVFATSSTPKLGYQPNQDNRNQLRTFGSQKQVITQFDNQKSTNRPLFPSQHFTTRYGSQQPSFVTTPSSVSKYQFSNTPSQNKLALIEQNRTQQPNFSDQSNLGLVTGHVSRGPFGPNQISNQTNKQNFLKQPTLTSSKISPKGTAGIHPDIFNSNNFERFTTVHPGSFYQSFTTETPNAGYQENSQFVQNEQDLVPGEQFPSQQSEYPITSSSRIPQKQFKSTSQKMLQQFNPNQYAVDDRQQNQNYGDDEFRESTRTKPGNVDKYPTNIDSVEYSKSPIPKQDIISSKTYSDRPERPQAEFDRTAYVINYDSVITPEGYAFSYDTSNGIHADESGITKDGTKAKGSYSYIGDDGKLYSITYTADENGYRPYGEHLPTPPPIPEAIQRVIEKVKQEKEAGIVDDGSYNEEKYGSQQHQDGYMHKSKIPFYIGDNIQDKKQNYPSNEEQTQNHAGLHEENISSDQSNRPYEKISSSIQSIYSGKEIDRPNIGKKLITKTFDDSVSIRPNKQKEFVQFQDDGTKKNKHSRVHDRYLDLGYAKEEGKVETTTDRPFNGKNDDLHPTQQVPTKFTGKVYEKQYYERPLDAMENSKKFSDNENYRPDSKFPIEGTTGESTVTISDDNISHHEKINDNESPHSGIPAIGDDTYYGTDKNSKIRTQTFGGNKPITQSINEHILSKSKKPYRPGNLKNDEHEDFIENESNFDDSKHGSTSKYHYPKDDSKTFNGDVYESGQQYIKTIKPDIFTTKYADTDSQYRPPGTAQTYTGSESPKDRYHYGNKIPVSSSSYRDNQDNKSGYQYIPPRSMFYTEDDEKRLAVTRPDSGTSRIPSQKFNDFKNAPFEKDQKTPSYSQNIDKIPDGKYYDEGMFNYDGPIDQNHRITKPSEEAYNPTRPSQGYNKSQQASEYDTVKGTLRQPQSGSDLLTTDGEYEENTPFNRISSNKKPSPTPSYYSTTQKNFVVPGEILRGQNGVEYDLTSPSTRTPLPTQGPEDDLTTSRLPSGSQTGELSDKYYKYASRIPSTTYRPNYKISSNNTSSIRPGALVDMYGRPVSTVTSQDYGPDSLNVTPSFKNRNKGFTRPTSERERYQPISDDIKENQYKSERIKGEDFSGPKQQQRFDAKTGYHY
ncbi:hypothetical protein ACJJTC_003136 [Scirpophaga incertulas]